MLGDELRKKEEEFIIQSKKNAEALYRIIEEDLIEGYTTYAMSHLFSIFFNKGRSCNVEDDGVRICTTSFAKNQSYKPTIFLPELLRIMDEKKAEDDTLFYDLDEPDEYGKQILIVGCTLSKAVRESRLSRKKNN